MGAVGNGGTAPIIPISPNCLPLKLYAHCLAWVMESISDTATVVYVHPEIMSRLWEAQD
jgi:hypothetical protein